MRLRTLASIAAALLLPVLLSSPASAYDMGAPDTPVRLSAGLSHTAFVDQEGVLWTWGSNQSGQLGAETQETGTDLEGTVIPLSSRPLQVMEDVASVSAGADFTVALKTDGTLWAWGGNDYGQLGNGSTTPSDLPICVLDQVTAVSAGDYHVAALRADGSLWTWGDNLYGQLGDGTLESRSAPAKVLDQAAAVSAGANEVDEDTMLNAIKAAHVEIKKIITFINGIVAERGKPKIDFQVVGLDMDVFHAIKEKYLDDFKAAMDTDDKNVRDAALLPIMDKIAEEYPDLTEADLDLVSYKMQKYVVRRWLLDEGKRVDGRGINEIRPLAAEVGILPRVHGSGMFTRGQTQVLTTCTLGGTKDNQLMDDLTDEQTKRYIHHYNFPPYSVGEARAPRSPGRREIGHGALAERALVPVLPSLEEFPYTIRCVSEVLSSNGSTSQASICGSTLALMDAGVPIKAPVAGISCGLITEGDRWMTMLDIQGVEDFHGDMDFKVGGTRKGITAIQMDIKIDGLTYDIIAEAFEKCRRGRLYILDEIIKPVIAEPRRELSRWAPKMFSMMIPTDKIKDVIGKGGKVIQDICATCNCKIDVQEDGHVFVSAVDQEDAKRAIFTIRTIVEDPEIGAIYKGKVTRLMNFGAFVEIAPGKEGLVHISKLDTKRVERVEDVVAVGDAIVVKVTDIDQQGRINLSRRDAILALEAKKAQQEQG